MKWNGHSRFDLSFSNVENMIQNISIQYIDLLLVPSLKKKTLIRLLFIAAMMVYEYNFHTILLNVIFIPKAIPSKRVKFIPFFSGIIPFPAITTTEKNEEKPTFIMTKKI